MSIIVYAINVGTIEFKLVPVLGYVVKIGKLMVHFTVTLHTLIPLNKFDIIIKLYYIIQP